MSQIESTKRRDYAEGSLNRGEKVFMIERKELTEVLNQLLKSEEFHDYGPNGLQVEGKDKISKIITGTTACQALIDAAIEKKADAILVHHGIFWDGDDYCVTHMKRWRLKALLAHDINLYAYHLPLDAHPTLGNNACLAKELDFEVLAGLDATQPYPIGLVGRLKTPMPLGELKNFVEKKLKREPQVVGDFNQIIKTVAWCTGGAQKWINKAHKKGVDLYLSGEISEPTVHFARENQISFMAAGHHATETWGAKALGEYLAEKFKLDVEFINIDNPA